MKRSVTSIKAATRLSHGIVPLLLVTIVLPLVVLVLLGGFAIFDYGYLIEFLSFLAVCSVFGLLPLWLSHKKTPESATVSGESFVSASADWGDYDNQVWNKLNQLIVQQLDENAEWGGLQQHALSLITRIAEEYHGSNKHRELAFTIPELLMMVEEISRRYRSIVKTHVPLIENISLSLLATGYDNKERLDSIFKSATWFWNTYRVTRLVNPVTAVIAELRGQAIGKLMAHVNTEIQLKLKQALLQEVVSVAIDLYSGRFKVEDQNLKSSASSQEDKKRMAAPLDPLRVCLVGQVSSGKSSVINALVKEMVAEVSMLPSTDKATVYQCRLDEMETLHLVDLPGFDGEKSTEKKLLNAVVNCDLVIWVLKANQPARALDIHFKALLDGYYAKNENRSRKRPVIIGILNQVDRLHPVTEWQPTYEFLQPTNQKEKNIKDALDYNRELLGFSTLIPLSVGQSKGFFNLDELQTLLNENYYEGLQAQLNRRRNETAGRFELTAQAKRIYQSGKSLFIIMKSKGANQEKSDVT